MVSDELHPETVSCSPEGVEGICNGIEVYGSFRKEPGYDGECICGLVGLQGQVGSFLLKL